MAKMLLLSISQVLGVCRHAPIAGHLAPTDKDHAAGRKVNFLRIRLTQLKERQFSEEKQLEKAGVRENKRAGR